jgi:hypothetical protein
MCARWHLRKRSFLPLPRRTTSEKQKPVKRCFIEDCARDFSFKPGDFVFLFQLYELRVAGDESGFLLLRQCGGEGVGELGRCGNRTSSLSGFRFAERPGIGQRMKANLALGWLRRRGRRVEDVHDALEDFDDGCLVDVEAGGQFGFKLSQLGGQFARAVEQFAHLHEGSPDAWPAGC